MAGRKNRASHNSGQPINSAFMSTLIVALIGSAYLLVMAVRSPDYWWIAWICLLPLFLAIRTLKPLAAALSGAIWGISFFLFSVYGVQSAIPFTFSSLALLALVPAIYCGLGSLLTRRVGFNPLILALGWICVELAFKPLGLHNGLLAATQSDSIHLHWIGRLLGYVFIAFLVACTNASLLAVLSNVRLSFSRERSIFEGLFNSEHVCSSQTFLYVHLWNLRQGFPRAPPFQA